MSLEILRPVDPSPHPPVTGNYRIATPAIEAFYELVVRCLRYRIMGALIYGPSRIGKTRAIEYMRLLLARNYPRMTIYHAQCEHKPRHAEGPFSRICWRRSVIQIPMLAPTLQSGCA